MCPARKTVGLVFLLLFNASTLRPANAIDAFVETFNGQGSFQSQDGNYSGLDHPAWSISGNGTIADGSYFSLKQPLNNSENFDVDRIERQLGGSGSFVHRLEIQDLEFSIDPEQAYGSGSLFLRHQLDDSGANFLFLALTNDGANQDQWNLVWNTGGQSSESAIVQPGSDIALELQFDEELQLATFRYDANINDLVPAQTHVAPYQKMTGETQSAAVQIDAFWGANTTSQIDRWSFSIPAEETAIPGDFDENGILDVADLDLLSAQIRSKNDDAIFDLNQDGRVSETDRRVWVHEIKSTNFGDTNLDGKFDSSDLVIVFRTNEYEDQLVGNSTWGSGDWNGDAEFGTSDLVFAFGDGAYEVGATSAATPDVFHAVPEPSSQLAATIFILFGILAGRSKFSRTKKKRKPDFARPIK